MTDRRAGVDRMRVRRLFSVRRDEPGFVALEIGQRMAERLDYVRLEARRILDSHSQPGGHWTALQERFPEALLNAAHWAPAQFPAGPGTSLPFARRMRNWLRPVAGVARCCTEMDALPFGPGAFDVVWSNLALHWQAEPHRVFPEWQRVLRPGGLVMFSTFGPDTLKEVAAAFRQVDDYPHVIPFTDMHDYGDMLIESGFVTPVMDMETMTLTYGREEALWNDVRALGGNPLLERRRGLLSRAQRHRLSAAFDAGRDGAGNLRLTFEVVYGHAWKGEPRTVADGRAILRRIDRAAQG